MFFKELSEMMTSGTVVNLTVQSLNGKLTVSVFPKANGLKDDAQNHLQPIVLTGIAEELNAGFFAAVSKPIQRATALLSDMKSFEASLARVEAEKKEAQEQKKTADKRTLERKAKYDKLISKADTQEAEKKYDNALQTLREARTMADGDDIEKTDERIDYVKAHCMQNGFF